jgi:L-threonylcarbamoyladenylate synthase
MQNAEAAGSRQINKNPSVEVPKFCLLRSAFCLSSVSFCDRSKMFNPRTTVVRRVSADRPDAAVIREAADVLRRGGLVAFPTETVYGLGANALDAAAVETIFAAKGRPATNPIIVHAADAETAKSLTLSWPEIADRLAQRFWPGSLTLVLPKHPQVPDVVTAGGPTVGIRVPAHPTALALLRASELPIAAPSANRATQISPTTAEHVFRGLNGRVDMILDAGPTPGGLESTVIDLTVQPPKLLRPGLVSIAELNPLIGEVDVAQACNRMANDEPARSPGQQPRHYAPRAKLIVSRQSEADVKNLLGTVNRVGWLRLPSTVASAPSAGLARVGSDEIESLVQIDMPIEPIGYAARLYAALHELDDAQVDVIVVDLPPENAAWLAIHDRLRRAAHPS